MKRFYLLLIVLSVLFGCKESEELAPSYSINYKLSGIYERDTSNKTDGYKSVWFKDDGTYCWTRVKSGKDSLFCHGPFKQTSDTSLLWADNTLVNFQITPIDTLPGWIKLQIFGFPAVPPLFGTYK